MEPQEKGLDWQSQACASLLPPECELPARGVAAFRVAIRLASAPIIRCCAAVGGSAALRMRHTPCGCRSAHLVEVQPNFRLPQALHQCGERSNAAFRRQSAAEQTSLAPHDSKARLRPVTNRRDSWRSHVHRTYTAQRVQSFKLQTANVRGQGAEPLAFSLGGVKGAILSREENGPLYSHSLRGRGESPRTPYGATI